ncbi:hypothetical protein CRG98_050035, partial [Punica granatum]
EKITRASFADGVLLAAVTLPGVLLAAIASLPSVRVENLCRSYAEQTREWSARRCGNRLASLSLKTTLFVADEKRLKLVGGEGLATVGREDLPRRRSG